MNFKFFRSAMLMVLALLTFSAHATNYTLWINGRNNNNASVGNYNDFRYWTNNNTVAAGVNRKSVNWNGYNTISSQNYIVRDALDCFCTGSNWCYIGTHSAGDLMMAYTLANYGASARYKKNPTAASGACTNSDGTTQTGWNIKWVRSASGAGGGSELSDYGTWTTSEPLVADLKTTTARNSFNHNTTRNIWFYMYAGANGTLYSGILPGQDDEAVAYHSTGGVAGSSGQALCNPADWLCNDLTLGTAANEGGSVKWAYHSVTFRDDAEAYNHYTTAWNGIVSVVRTDMVTYAK